MLETILLSDLRRSLEEEDGSTDEVVAKTMRCLEETGFLLLSDETEADCLTALLDSAAELFRQPPEAKQQMLSTDRAKRGYSGYSTENFASLAGRPGPNDAVEKFRIGPELDPELLLSGADRRQAKELRRFYFPNQWTGVPAELRELCLTHYRRMEAMVDVLLGVLERGLGIAKGFFADHMHLHTSIMTLNYYPEETHRNLRMAAHTDVSLLTVLIQTDCPLGLQVLIPDPAGDSCWVDVPHAPGSFVVNVGDCLESWTQGRLRSTFHRVVASSEGRAEERLSVGYFASPRHDAVLKSPWSSNDPGISYNRWRDRRVREAMNSLKEFSHK